MSSNLPDDVSNDDPRAPWNQPDAPEHETKTIAGKQADGQEASITFCTACHRTEDCDDWEDPCPVKPEEDEGPDVDATMDAERDERAMRDLEEG